MNDAQKGEKTTFQKFKTGFGRKKQEVFVYNYIGNYRKLATGKNGKS